MKKKGDFTVDFFLTQESFINWARGDRSQAEYWENWIESHPDHKDQFNKALFIASEMNIKEHVISEDWIDQIKRGIDDKIDHATPTLQLKATHVKSERKRYWYYTAASFLLLAGFSFYLGYIANGRKQSEQLIYKETQKGQKLTFYLNDGTKVMLNSLSKLNYGDFTDSSRTVFLRGEAFFDVVKDSLRPFTVVTNFLNTTVLGTSFNVKAIEDYHSVALVTGSVFLEDHKHNKLKLLPGMVASGGKEKSLSYSDVDISSQVGWKDGIIIFNQADREEVFKELSLWYGVEFVIEENINDRPWKYTGNFDNKSLNVVLMSLSYVKNFTYRIENDTVYIKI